MKMKEEEIEMYLDAVATEINWKRIELDEDGEQIIVPIKTYKELNIRRRKTLHLSLIARREIEELSSDMVKQMENHLFKEMN